MARRQKTKRTVAFHEAGHAVAAVLQNIPFKYATIVPNDVQLGHVWLKPAFASVRSHVSALDYRHRKLIMLLAGPAAEKKLHPRSRSNPFEIACYPDGNGGLIATEDGAFPLMTSMDLQMAGGILWDMHDGNGPVVDAHYEYIKALATASIETNWKAVEAVAAALIERGTLMDHEVRVAMLPQSLREAA